MRLELHRALAELKGLASSMPHPEVLVNTLALQEAKASSEIENLVTTQDELFRAQVDAPEWRNRPTREVFRYVQAMRVGQAALKEHGWLTMNLMEEIQIQLLGNDAGFRRQAGTVLKNDRTGEIVYTPPQTRDEVLRHLSNLERFINDGALCGWDPLIKMAVIHHQFESIHPFYDGNGRTGRLLNVLYLVQQQLLDQPILYHSRFINNHKETYYRLLQSVETTARETAQVIREVLGLIPSTQATLKSQTKFYSPQLLQSLFKFPYTKIEFLAQELGVSAVTARSYLEQMVAIGLLRKVRVGRPHYYVNHAWVAALEGNSSHRG